MKTILLTAAGMLSVARCLIMLKSFAMKYTFVIAGMLCLIHTGYAQTPSELRQITSETNRVRLQALSDSFNTAFLQNRNEVMKFAKIKQWPLYLPQEGGGMRELYGIGTDSLPVYACTLNKGAGITTRADKLYTGGGLGLSVHGEGMVAGLWDVSGILLSHEAFENRVAQKDPIYTAVTANHSTHVAGTIIASERPQSGNVRGMAFKARLHAYDWYNDLSEAAIAAANGLLLSCHPYSMAPQPISYWGAYIPRTASWDQIMYNASYYLVVWAGGNGGPYADRLTNEAANKNGLAVASVFQLNEYTGPASVQLSAFSSRGPARDGRIKPDICAKGEAVFSANYNSNNTSYNYGWGTSMASAGATGTLLLLQQHYRNRSGQFMKAATLKALAIHTADEAGPSPGPDIAYGWGVLNAQRAAALLSKEDIAFTVSENTLTNGDVYVKTVTADCNIPLAVTLCWTDPPAAAVTNTADVSPRLINDLDIRITQAGNTWYPWKLDPANVSGPAIAGDNTRDNLEKVEIAAPEAGSTYTISISHKGHLLTNGAGRQDFSLIISGAAACQADRVVTGMYSENITRSASWIKVVGKTTISPDKSITLQADAANGYIDIAPETNSDYFMAAPQNGDFTAELTAGCSSGNDKFQLLTEVRKQNLSAASPVYVGKRTVVEQEKKLR